MPDDRIVKLCECGCGNSAPIASYTSTRNGWVKGQPVRFVHGHNARKPDGQHATKERPCADCGGRCFGTRCWPCELILRRQPTTITCPDCGAERQVDGRGAWHAARNAVPFRCHACSCAARARKILAAGKKPCSLCGRTKPLDAFSRQAKSKTGRVSHCKACERKRTRAFYLANKDSILRKSGAWARRNPEKRREILNRRRARQGAEKVDYAAILEEHGRFCHICGDPIGFDFDLHFDHVIPLARGGLHVAANIKPAHKTCNLRKGDRVA